MSGALNRVPLGVSGLDAVLRGGIPEGRTTLVSGGTGTGKTVLGLQALVHGVMERSEPGLHVAFEEDRRHLAAHAASFGWDMATLERRGLVLLDARPDVDAVHSGSFDLGGLLSVVAARARESGAKRVVFDAIDVILHLLPSQFDVRRELARMNTWLLESGLTALLTAKPDGPGDVATGALQYLVDCAIELDQHNVAGVTERSLRVVKYRGTGYGEGSHPVSIGPAGFSVGYVRSDALEATEASSERLSTGIEALDTMLGGGYFRGASVLVTGAPGTAKTTLACAFAASACARGERTLFVSFDSHAGELVRNLRSVGIDLGHWREEGLLTLESPRAVSGSAESHRMAIRAEAERLEAVCLVVDPLSALAKHGSYETARNVIERLVTWSKVAGVTSLFTSLLDGEHPEQEGTPMQASTIADTWIHLSYRAHAGERNRALTIIKSRGTGHSNQVRELLLSDSGATLAHVFTAGGEVLMGTLRVEREREELERRAAVLARGERELAEIDARERALEAERASLERELRGLEARRREHADGIERASRQHRRDREAVHVLRGGDLESRPTTSGGSQGPAENRD